MANAWIKQRLAQVHKASDRTVVGIVVDKSEVQEAAKGGDLDFIKHLAQSKEFRQDLNMSQAYWFYTPDTYKRCLLLQHSSKADAKPEEIRKAMRGLGAKAA